MACSSSQSTISVPFNAKIIQFTQILSTSAISHSTTLSCWFLMASACPNCCYPTVDVVEDAQPAYLPANAHPASTTANSDRWVTVSATVLHNSTATRCSVTDSAPTQHMLMMIQLHVSPVHHPVLDVYRISCAYPVSHSST